MYHINKKLNVLVIIYYAIFLLTGCSRNINYPEVSYGKYEMKIYGINQIHTLQINVDLTWEHKITNDPNSSSEFIYIENGKFTLSKVNGVNVLNMDDFSSGYDMMKPIDETIRVNPVKHGGVRFYIDSDNTGSIRLVKDEEYGYFYRKIITTE